VDIHMIEVEAALPALKGVAMEIEDCAFPLVNNLVCTAQYAKGFEKVDMAILVGAKPRGPGMQRKDLLSANAKIFQEQGNALNQYGTKDTRVLVVGNPANTNALICAMNAPDIPKNNFSALTRLDQNRAVFQAAKAAKVPVGAVSNVIIWGNHSKTQVPDVSFAVASMGPFTVPVKGLINNDTWLQGDFMTTVQDRGAAIIEARKLSSAASAANAVVDHVRDWFCGTDADRFVSMAVYSDGSVYGVPKDVIFSFPVVCHDREWSIVSGLEPGPFIQEKIKLTIDELLEERMMALGK